MIGNKKRNKIYDGRECLKIWLEVGTLKLTCKVLYDRGVRNRKGEMPSVYSIIGTINYWMAKNHDEARKMLIEAGYDNLRDDKEWADFIIRRGVQHLKEKQLFRWLEKHNLLEYGRELKLIPADYGKNRTI